jgi:hypothetical protein
MTEEVQYYCEKCDMNFCVYHQNENRNSSCCWCGSLVKQTGRVGKIQGNEIITYQDGIEIERRIKPPQPCHHYKGSGIDKNLKFRHTTSGKNDRSCGDGVI